MYLAAIVAKRRRSAAERLILKYDGGSGAAPYIEGTFLAVRKVNGMVGLTRGLDNLLDL